MQSVGNRGNFALFKLRKSKIETVLDYADGFDERIEPLESRANRTETAFAAGFRRVFNYSDGRFRTAATCLLFSGMQINEVENSGLVALPGI
jgi:hypothetical protein